MPYQLQCIVLGRSEVTAITESEYQDLLTARRGLLDLLAIEEKYDLLLRNFVSFERTVHDTTLSSLYFSERSWSDFIDRMQDLNLEVMNLLSMCRTYVDHIPQHLSAIFGQDSAEKLSFIERTKAEYDTTLGYRALYALRNYVQHSGLPIHSMTFNNKWVDERKACNHSVSPYILTETLEKDGSFKRSVLSELKQIGERVDLRTLVLENMSSFSRLHKFVRTLVQEKVTQCDAILIGAQERFLSEHGGDILGLAAVKVDEVGSHVSVNSLFDDLIKRRQYLASKNRPMTNIEKHFITSRIDD